MFQPPPITPQLLITWFVIGAFQLWMLVDAIRRRSFFIWKLLIFLIPLAAIASLALPAVRRGFRDAALDWVVVAVGVTLLAAIPRIPD